MLSTALRLHGTTCDSMPVLFLTYSHVHRLWPGEIDPNPETKPARLDPIDMDEDGTSRYPYFADMVADGPGDGSWWCVIDVKQVLSKRLR